MLNHSRNPTPPHIASHRLGVAANGGGLPRRVNAGGIRLVQLRLPCRVEPNNEGGNAKGPHAAALRVALLDARNVARDVVHRHLLVQRQTVALRVGESVPVDQGEILLQYSAT